VTASAPRVPWQVTGNHWVSVPCIHPADASIHCIGGVNARLRGALEFAGGGNFTNGDAPPLIRIVLDVDGERLALGREGIAWERESGWIPAFSTRVGELAIRGLICAPHAKEADISGFVISLTIENRGNDSIPLTLGLEGTLGQRQVRIRSPRSYADSHSVTAGADGAIVLEGSGVDSHMAIAVGGEQGLDIGLMETSGSWSIGSAANLAPGETRETHFFVAVGFERDGAVAMLRTMRRHTGAALVERTIRLLREMSPATGNAAADRLIARHAFFCYFNSVVRALDDSRWYIVRSRLPWNDQGLTIRDWHALMWILPAVQLVDRGLAREVLLRICELHGYEPGSGIHYLDGSSFEPGFSLEGASAFAIAVDAYIVETADDKVVEEPVLAEALYASHEDLERHRHSQYPLYSTDVNPDGSVPAYPFTTHGNAVAALALDILRHTLDEKTAEKVEDAAAVRASLSRQLAGVNGGKPVLCASGDLAGNLTLEDNPSASLYWLPYYDFIERDDSIYRRTVKPFESHDVDSLELRVARLVGPAAADAFDWLRRAPLDGGFAASHVDAEGRAASGGGDAALSGLIACTVWHAINVLGVRG
jgi:hypothetical protein